MDQPRRHGGHEEEFIDGIYRIDWIEQSLTVFPLLHFDPIHSVNLVYMVCILRALGASVVNSILRRVHHGKSTIRCVVGLL